MPRPRPPVDRVPGAVWRVVAALAAGPLLALSFPPLGWWWLQLPGVALLSLACRGVPARAGGALGLLAGSGFFLLLLPWTAAVAGSAAWLGLSLLEAAFVGLLGAGLSLTSRLGGWPVWQAALWVGTEAVRSRGPFGGFPWGRLAFAHGGTPWTGWAAVGGAPLVTFTVALVAGCGCAAVLSGRGARGRGGWVAVALVAGGAAALLPAARGGTPVTVAAVQGNVPRLGLGFNAQRAAVLSYHVAATHQLAAEVRAGRLAAPALVVWPENASDLDPFTDPAAASVIDAAVRDVGVPTLVGAVLDGPGGSVLNAGVVWDPVGGPGERYVKRHLVPFGEYIPHRALLRRLTHRVDLVPRDFAPGPRPGVLTLGPTVVGDVICFEVAFDGLVRDVVTGGGRVLVVQTNNATFGRSGESSQQLEMSRLRAVETGRAVVVAATSGISAVVAPDGSVQGRTGFFRRGLLVRQVRSRTGLTLAVRLGAWPELALSGVGGLACLAGIRAGRR